MLDAGLPFVAAGSCMNRGRIAAPSGGRSVAAAPPTGREVAAVNLHATTSVGRPVTAPPRLGREVAMNTLMFRGGSWRNNRLAGRASGVGWRRVQDSSGKGNPPPAAPLGRMGHRGGEDGGRYLPTAPALRLLLGGPRQ